MRILNIDPDNYSPSARAIYRELGTYVEKSLTRKQLLAEIGDYDVLVLRYNHLIDREVLDWAKRLKIIATNLTGTDHIDEKEAAVRNIRLVSLRGSGDFLNNIHASAEHTWALLLALMRRIPAACRSVLKKEWDRNRFTGTELNGKCLGIVGLGRNGCKIAGYAAAFGMSVCGYDPYATEAPDSLERRDSLETLLSGSDIVSLHVPLNDDTRQMFNQDRIRRMRQGALLVNTSRGDILDESALLEALQSGHLAGAALDVLSGEIVPGEIKKHPLIAYAKKHDNLIITPHIGGVTKDSWEKTEQFVAERVRDSLKQE